VHQKHPPATIACSLEREEGEEQIAPPGLEPRPISASELPEGVAPTPGGWLRTDPGMLAEIGGLDGFYAARWRR
jgi:16S rRNA (cytosine967-C5)-methyltransferase